MDFDLTVDTQAAGIYSAVFGFAYDGQGNLVKMTLPNGDYTLYYFGNYEINYSAGGSKNSAITYYPAGGAMRVETWLPVFPSYVSEVFYVLSDHLGSTSVVTDASGGNPIYTGYYPFGETRYTTGALPTDRLYTPLKGTGQAGPAAGGGDCAAPCGSGCTITRPGSITPSNALRLARFFGNSPDFWMNLQLRWDLYFAQKAEKKVIASIRPYRSHAISGKAQPSAPKSPPGVIDK